MLLPIKITLQAVPAGVSKRRWNAATKAGFEAVGAMWHEEMLPDHFLASASSRYHYRPRSRAYLARKLKGGHGRDPLVYRGLMKELLTSSRITRAFPTRVTIRMIGPRYVTMRTISGLAQNVQAKIRASRSAKALTRTGSQPDKSKELTTVTSAERRLLGQRLRLAIRQHLESTKPTRPAQG